MPRRGQFRRDFPEAGPEPAAVVGRIGERVVSASGSTRSIRTFRLDPDDFACAQLAGELADEWVEYMAVAGLSANTVGKYRQAIADLCSSVDSQLGQDAARASLARDIPDLARALAAWKRTLPSGFSTGSTVPAALSSAVHILLRRRAEHPDRPVAARVAALARSAGGVSHGETTELDEFTRAEKQALVRAAWNAVIALEKRLASGWNLVGSGRHPAEGSWTAVPDLLWGLANDAITLKDINDHVPPMGLWPEQLLERVRMPDGTVPFRNAKMRLNRSLAAELWPTSLDLHAFRVLLMDATGHPPEEVGLLTEDGVEFTPGGVRLALVRKRAQRRYYRAFQDAALEMADVVETVQFTDQPRCEAGAVLRRLMDVTERARAKAADPDGKLFVRGAVGVDLTLRFGEWNPEASGNRFTVWLDRNQVTVVGRTDVRRLRKSVKVEKVVAAGGHISDAADDHHTETFRRHYAQGTTLRVISAEVINDAQEHWFSRAVNGPTIVTELAASAAGDTTAPARLGLSQAETEALIRGELDMGVTHCKDPYDSPFSPAGELCAVAPLRCLECRNAWVLPSQLPQLLLFADHLERIRQRLDPPRFTRVWGQSYVNLRAVLADRSKQEIALARKHIAAGGIALDLPLSAHVEFDA
jgi:hypothetical protein